VSTPSAIASAISFRVIVRIIACSLLKGVRLAYSAYEGPSNTSCIDTSKTGDPDDRAVIRSIHHINESSCCCGLALGTFDFLVILFPSETFW
jgi:hypothetical protein